MRNWDDSGSDWEADEALRVSVCTLRTGSPKPVEIAVSSVDRTFGTILGSEITRRWGASLPEDTVTWAEGRLMTRYGLVVSRWEAMPDGRLVFSFTIPPNTTATVRLPGRKPYDVPAGSYTVR